MRCTNRESKMYECPVFQRADGICELWEMHDRIDDEEDSEQKECEP